MDSLWPKLNRSKDDPIFMRYDPMDIMVFTRPSHPPNLACWSGYVPMNIARDMWVRRHDFDGRWTAKQGW